VKNWKQKFGQNKETEIQSKTGNRNLVKKQETEIWSKNRKQKFGQKHKTEIRS
jgi:hypothetical protein